MVTFRLWWCRSALGMRGPQKPARADRKMEDEPIRCFDGRPAPGRRPPIAPPKLELPAIYKPGKSLTLRLAARGQDPPDLARSGPGTRCDEDVTVTRAGLADMLWVARR